MFGFRTPTRDDICQAAFFGQPLQITQLPNQWVMEDLSTGLKRPRQESDHKS